MEPIKINVNVEVGLKQTTLEALAALFARPSAPGFDPMPAPKDNPQPEPMPEPVGASPVGTGAEDDDDLPPDDAPAPKKPTSKPAPTENDARQAVKAARDRGVPAKTIKALMKDNFGIATSVECPVERRQELIDELNKLAA